MSQIYESHNDVFSTLPVKLYKHNLQGHKLDVSMHWHRSVEVTINLDGQIQYNTSSSNFQLVESDWVIVNSCEFHSCRCISPTDTFTGLTIILSLDFVEKWVGKRIFLNNYHNMQLTKQMKVIAEELYNANEQSPEHQLFVMAHIFQLLQLLSANCMDTEKRATETENDVDITLLQNLTEYIEQHYREDITLNSVADYFSYSESYFSRLFKKTLGVNFLAYLNFVRVSHAAEQLSRSRINVMDCALQNGFPNTKSFISTFKKAFGCTPSMYNPSKQISL